MRAKGSHLWDSHGNRYLDATSGALVANIGHGRREVAEAAARQIRQLDFVHGSQFSSEPFEQLAAALTPFAPEGAWRFFAVSGGSEATESALKLARQVQLERGDAERTIIVSRSTGYHGASLGALAASGLGSRRDPYEPMINTAAFEKISSPRPGDTAQTQLAEFEHLLDRLGAHRIAALMLEPVIGAASPGLASPAGTYEAFRALCDKHGILLIFDEVMSGLGRCGRPLALDHWDAVPDVVVLGKGLGAGYAPLAGILVSEQVVNDISLGSGSFRHGFTYAGHPVSAAVGIEVLRILSEEKLVELAERSGTRLQSELKRLQIRHPELHAVRGYGLLIGLLFGPPGETHPFKRPGYAYTLKEAALEVGLNTYPGTGSEPGGLGDHLLIGPPLNASTEDLTELVEKLDTALVLAKARLEGYC